MRIFLIGPVGALPGHDGQGASPAEHRAAMMEAEAHLRALGYDTANPARLRDAVGWEFGAPGQWRHLLVDCQGAATLPGWQCEREALEQKRMAEALCLTVQPLDTWPAVGPALAPLGDPPLAVQMVGIANQGRGLHSVPLPGMPQEFLRSCTAALVGDCA